jgi:hypothetical protein
VCPRSCKAIARAKVARHVRLGASRQLPPCRSEYQNRHTGLSRPHDHG